MEEFTDAPQSIETLDQTTVPDKLLKIISEISTKVSQVLNVSEKEKKSKISERLVILKEKISSWDINSLFLWDCSQEDAFEYLGAVEEVRQLSIMLGKIVSKGEIIYKRLLDCSNSVLQLAMVRLEDEFTHLLVKYGQPIENRYSGEGYIDLVNPDAIPDLKCIAHIMYLCKYDQECLQAYIINRRQALQEYFAIFEMTDLHIEELISLEWESLNDTIKKWIECIKIFIKIYLPSEKHFCDQIFGETGSVSSNSVIEISKCSILQLMNFVEALVMSPSISSQKLFLLLDMYETLSKLLPDMAALFLDGSGSWIMAECTQTLKKLGIYARGTFIEFKNEIRGHESTSPLAGGGNHPLCRYVMNYIKALMIYTSTMNAILEDCDEDCQLPNQTSANIEDSSSDRSRFGIHIQSVIAILESKLDEKSRLYNDSSLQDFFLMNNIHYMTDKVKNSDLQNFVGHDWIRTRKTKFRELYIRYERSVWNPLLSFLKDDGIRSQGSNVVNKKVLKERFKGFNLAFEEIYKKLTAWMVHDEQLRVELRISISLKALQAYRVFLGKYSVYIDGKHNNCIRYTYEDLENYLSHLFEGSPRSLQHHSHQNLLDRIEGSLHIRR